MTLQITKELAPRSLLIKKTILMLFLMMLITWEFTACTTGTSAIDSDGDGLTDPAEILLTGTDPFNTDTDGDGIPDGAEATLTIQVENKIPPADGGPCAPYVTNSETIKIFLPTGPPAGIGIPYNGRSAPYPLHLGTSCGLGIQVNFWYWTRHPENPVSSGPPQNPDNSGANFLMNADCTFRKMPPCAGDGKETYIIADVTSAMQNGVCVITVKPNNHTGCVTHNCCSPYAGMGKCEDTLPRTYACPDPSL